FTPAQLVQSTAAMNPDDVEDAATIEIIADHEPPGAEGPLVAVVGGMDPHGLYYPKPNKAGTAYVLPPVHRGESGKHYYDRIFSGESEPLPDGYQGPPRPLSVKEVFEKGHCGDINAQAALKYGSHSRGR